MYPILLYYAKCKCKQWSYLECLKHYKIYSTYYIIYFCKGISSTLGLLNDGLWNRWGCFSSSPALCVSPQHVLSDFSFGTRSTLLHRQVTHHYYILLLLHIHVEGKVGVDMVGTDSPNRRRGETARSVSRAIVEQAWSTWIANQLHFVSISILPKEWDILRLSFHLYEFFMIFRFKFCNSVF